MLFKDENLPNKDLLGLLMFLGPLEFFLVIVIAQGMAASYHTGIHYVGTLGVGETALLFNVGVILLGFSMVFASYFIHQEYNKKIFSILLLLSGLSALGVGLFPENSRPFHGIFTGFVFLFAALFLISSITVGRTPILYLTSIMGFVILIMSFIFLPYLGLEVESNVEFMGFMKGTLERFIIYPTLVGVILLGGYLSSKNQ